MENIKFTVAIVDDQPEEMFLIRKYVENLDFLKLLFVVSDPLQALEYLERKFVDILILDMQMPRINGIELLRALPHVPVLIVCSNYTDYVYDTSSQQTAYIRKTIGRADFEGVMEKAVRLCRERRAARQQSDHSLTVKAVRASEGVVVVDCNKLIYAEIRDKIMHFYGEDYALCGRIAMNELQTLLHSPPYMRVHKSFLVNFNYIESFSSRMLLLRNAKNAINIGDEYYADFKEAITSWQAIA